MALIDTTTVTDGNSNNTNNIILGTEFDDVIIAGLAEQQTYVANNGQIRNVNDNDVVEGSLGDDVMTGGYGNDKFVFNFTVETCAVTQVVLLFRDGDAPSTKSDAKAWTNYTTQLAAWRELLIAEHGDDEDATNTFNHDIRISKDKPDTQNFEGDNSFAWSEETLMITGEGHDSVLDWGNGNDSLELAGLSNDAEADNYWANWLTAEDVTDGQTVISFNGGSITLVGVDTTLEALVAGGQIVFI